MPSPDAIPNLNAALDGRYVIERAVGEGGMAVVYLAKDLRHNRQVALKVLKTDVAAALGAERFLAEIQTTANLQHPQILPLFDSGQADSHLFYVMPYVEGETLKQRLARERQLPVAEAVRIATEVAQALQAAHEQGVIHRDIKPANILMSRGRPLLADFGIAFAFTEAGGRTETGLSIGTPTYMSPEQVSSDRPPTAASDVYSTACVLYEMLVGEPPYTGSSSQVILAKALTQEAPLPTKVRASTPPNVDGAIRKALEKLPADRFTSAQEFAQALGDPTFRYGSGAEGIDRTVWKRVAGIGWAAAVALFTLVVYNGMRPDLETPVARFRSPFQDGQAPTRQLELTPDGSSVVYIGPGAVGGGDQLWVRRWADLDATPVPGTEGAVTMVVSQDGTSIAATFGFPGPLQVLPIEGGPHRTLVSGAWVVTEWADDGFIYYQRGDGGGLSRVPANGGDEEPLTQVAEGEQIHGEMKRLPGGDMAVFQVWHDLGGRDAEIWTFDLESRERRFLTAGRSPKFSPTGHLLFGTSEGFLMAVSMDPRTAELKGDPFLVVPGLATDPNFGVMYYGVAPNGTLLYRTGEQLGGNFELVWASRAGGVEAVETGWSFFPTTNNAGWSLSSDGTRVAFGQRIDGNNDIWIKNLQDSTLVRLTSYEGQDVSPTWTPDGRYVTYFRDAGVALSDDGYAARDFNAWWRRSDGTGVPEMLVDAQKSIVQGHWTPDGRRLLLRTAETATQLDADHERDILIFERGSAGAVPVIESTEFREHWPTVSPNGRWLAYSSDETGRDEVYVRPFPDVDGGRVQVSRSGGIGPLWSRGTDEIFYIDEDRNLVAAAIVSDGPFEVTRRDVLFPLPQDISTAVDVDFYDVAPGGQRFLMARRIPAARGNASHVLVQGWFQQLRSLEPR